MKIDVTRIVMDHLDTLRDAQSHEISKFDWILFFGLPLSLAIAAFWICLYPSKDVFNVSITFFGIFIALLLNMQVAAFGIFQRKRAVPTDARLAEIQEKRLALRQQLLGEMNANISYLIFV